MRTAFPWSCVRLGTALFWAWTAGGPAAAQEGGGITGAPILQIPLGARPVGMGGAFTGVADDVFALAYNPGGLASLGRQEASFLYLRGLAGQNVEHLALAGPLPFSGLSGSGGSAFGASLLFSQNGALDWNRTFPDGSFQDSRSVSAGGDIVATLGYAERLGDTPIETLRGTTHVHHFLGGSGKFIRSTLAEMYSASAFAADMGYLARLPDKGWSAGASLLNLGTRMTFVEVGDRLPMTFRAGGAYELKPAGKKRKIVAAVDGDYLVYEREWHVNTGFEIAALDRLAGRMGYQIRQDLAGLTVGFGLAWPSIRMDYAWAMSDAVNDTHRFTFTYRFDAPEGASWRGRPFSRREWEEKGKPKRRPGTSPREASPQEGQAPGWIY